jgi:signal recognition particle subunit SRP68
MLLMKNLVDRLDIYYEDANNLDTINVTNLTSEFIPIPCKPLFFDLALNHIELPSYEDKIDSKKTQQPAGVKGFFKGLLGFN